MSVSDGKARAVALISGQTGPLWEVERMGCKGEVAMPSDSRVLELPEASFVLLRDLIHERTGLFYEEGKRDLLVDRLSPRVVACGFDSFLDYYYFLKYDEGAKGEWRRLMDALSVQETYFWREMDQVWALVEVLVPDHFAARPGEPLRIWCAACATGEEPLTIGIALEEAGWMDRAPIQIYGTDASPRAVERARRGVYRERALRNLPPALREKYFTRVEEGWQIDPALHARVRWGVVNLVDEAEAAVLASARVIFCRNVFIYFSPQAVQKVAALFHRRMPTPGYLFIGASESLLQLETGFELEEIGGALVYIKR